MSNGTLLEKWMPSVKGARSRYAHKLAELLGMTDREYRKYLSSKRATLNLVESKMCKNEWDKIDYPSVPSLIDMMKRDIQLSLKRLKKVKKRLIPQFSILMKYLIR